jgi:hypothetical protein
MYYRFQFLPILFFLFVAASANQVLACGDKGSSCCSGKNTEQSCGSNDNISAGIAQSDNSGTCGEKHHPCKPCNKDGKGRDCHCPGNGAVTCGFAVALLTEAFPVLRPISASDDLKRQAFYFAEHLPESVYLPIWQPPQLGA